MHPSVHISDLPMVGMADRTSEGDGRPKGNRGLLRVIQGEGGRTGMRDMQMCRCFGPKKKDELDISLRSHYNANVYKVLSLSDFDEIQCGLYSTKQEEMGRAIFFPTIATRLKWVRNQREAYFFLNIIPFRGHFSIVARTNLTLLALSYCSCLDWHPSSSAVPYDFFDRSARAAFRGTIG